MKADAGWICSADRTSVVIDRYNAESKNAVVGTKAQVLKTIKSAVQESNLGFDLRSMRRGCESAT
jgi:hypothetical protein